MDTTKFFEAHIRTLSGLGRTFVEEQTPYQGFDKKNICMYKNKKQQLKTSCVRLRDKTASPLDMNAQDTLIHLNQIYLDEDISDILLLLVYREHICLYKIPMKALDNLGLKEQHGNGSHQVEFRIKQISKYVSFKWDKEKVA